MTLILLDIISISLPPLFNDITSRVIVRRYEMDPTPGHEPLISCTTSRVRRVEMIEMPRYIRYNVILPMIRFSLRRLPRSFLGPCELIGGPSPFCFFRSSERESYVKILCWVYVHNLSVF